MKKLISTLILVGILNIATFAQFHGHGGGAYYRPRTTVIIGGWGYSPFYSPFGYYGYGYPYYGAPLPIARPSKLDQEIADITHDYREKIESVRMDHSLSGKERRHKIRELRSERDNEIDKAKRNYYK